MMYCLLMVYVCFGPSFSGFEYLVNICCDYFAEYEVVFN